MSEIFWEVIYLDHDANQQSKIFVNMNEAFFWGKDAILVGYTILSIQNGNFATSQYRKFNDQMETSYKRGYEDALEDAKNAVVDELE